ncbi:MAG: FecCD family ABC transporter permease, partial [Candidatus Methylomirabilales bacterium]
MTTSQRWMAISILVAAASLLGAGVVVSMMVGVFSVPMDRVLRLLLVDDGSAARGVVWDLRLPRALVGAMVGANLAVAGGLFQGVTRNPLAAPSIVGVSAGAGFAVVLVKVVVQGFPEPLLPFAAFVGAAGAGVVVFGMAWKQGISPVRLVLAGVAVALFLSGLTTGILLSAKIEPQANEVYFWMAGGILGRGWTHVSILWPWVVGGLLLSLLFAWQANILLLAEDVARSLGIKLHSWRLGLGVLGLVLAASAVSVAGPIGFLGIVVPHTARLLVGPDHRW